jgi:hypothetical protein
MISMQEIAALFPPKYRKYVIYLSCAGLALTWCITHADTIKNAAVFFQSPDAKVELSSARRSLTVGAAEELAVSIYPTAQHKLLPGTVTITTSSDALKISPETYTEVGEISGSLLLKKFKVRAIKESAVPVEIFATYRTGEISRTSNAILFSLVPKPPTLKPHFEVTDTKRIVLSGEWEITLGADSGVLQLRQTESKLSGTYEFPYYKWRTGKVLGSKDGNTYRMQFLIPSKKVEERLWVVGDYSIQKETGSIQMRGCAYHLRHDLNQRLEQGAQGVDCSISVKFSNWKTLQADTFMATASFDFVTDD